MIKSIASVKVTNRRVILRAGFDVPIENGKVIDDTRIKDILSTLNHLIKEKAKIVIISHLGRPEGWDKSKSLLPVANQLGELVKAKITFLADDITKQDLSGLSRDLADGAILFLENMRFYPGEEKNDENFCKLLAQFGDLYVNDAFSVAHRKEASTFGIAKLLPAYAGLGLVKEISVLKKIINTPAQPFVLMMGGAKIDDKEAVIHNLARHTSVVLTGGVLANTFLKAHGYDVGVSKVSNVSLAKNLLRHYKHKIELPVDVIVAKNAASAARCVGIDKIKSDESIYDIGPETVKKYSKWIKQAQTLVWNGPFGLFEHQKFATGSKALAQIFASRAKGQAYGVIGGGETIELFNQAKASEFVDHISTGGGAMLEFLAGNELPSIKVLEKNA